MSDNGCTWCGGFVPKQPVWRGEQPFCSEKHIISYLERKLVLLRNAHRALLDGRAYTGYGE